jgi:hypothetical protein
MAIGYHQQPGTCLAPLVSPDSQEPRMPSIEFTQYGLPEWLNTIPFLSVMGFSLAAIFLLLAVVKNRT